MSTPAYIAVRVGNNVREIYLNNDGYPSWVKPLLLKHHNGQDKAVALTELGDLSELAKSVECPMGHSFENKVKGYCVAYGRDRDESSCNYNEYPVESYHSDGCDDHQYYYNNGWHYRENSNSDWVALVDVETDENS